MEDTIYLRVAGTDADGDCYAPIRFDCEIVEAYIMDGPGITAHASNYMTFALKHGTTSLASRNTSTGTGSTLAAVTEEALSVTGRPRLSEGEYLHLDANKTGTGPAYNTTVAVKVRRVQ